MTEARSTGRIAARFAALASEGRSGLAIYVMAGDPDFETALAILRALPAAGADVIEVGLPATRAPRDGVFIKAAHRRARAAGFDARRALDLVRAFRDHDAATPVVLMGYRASVDEVGGAKFAEAATEAGADAVLVADGDDAWFDRFGPEAMTGGLAVIRLVTPDLGGAALTNRLRHAGGFVYYATVKGPTGGATAASDALQQGLARLRAVTKLPIGAGFGIKTPAQAAEAARIADAVIVGTAIVERITARLGGESGGRETLADAVAATVDALARAVRGARTGETEEAHR